MQHLTVGDECKWIFRSGNACPICFVISLVTSIFYPENAKDILLCILKGFTSYFSIYRVSPISLIRCDQAFDIKHYPTTLEHLSHAQQDPSHPT